MRIERIHQRENMLHLQLEKEVKQAIKKRAADACVAISSRELFIG
jgi:hypothetical protein